jgi:biopolymer transport protein ExbD
MTMTADSPNSDDDIIVGINVTPLVDVVLVLLVALMVTATYIASRSIPLDLPKATTGQQTKAPLVISIDRTGKLFVDASPVEEPELRRRVESARAADPELRAVVAADGDVPHRTVVRIIDLLRSLRVVRIAFNVQPEDRATAAAH